ncbi:MAG TPA: DUF5313 family protein [Pseudonocardiaceae bacterium]
MAGNRPGPVLWLFYCYGGRLPHRYAQWVLHDQTSRHWVLRLVMRTVAETLPAWLFLLLPGPLSLTILLPVFVLLGATFLAFSFADEIRVHRLYQHGFLPELVLPGGMHSTNPDGDAPDPRKDHHPD